MKTKVEKIEDFLNSLRTEIDVLNCVDSENVDSYEDVYEQIENNQGFDEEVIYYSVAMDYLMENDPSLNESLSIAQEMGFEVNNLNSETLASLLKSQNIREEFYELENEITEFFDELEDDEEE